ncbi:MAG: hypothetical protein RIS09_931, partial [Actinomycetota bacterium]
MRDPGVFDAASYERTPPQDLA